MRSSSSPVGPPAHAVPGVPFVSVLDESGRLDAELEPDIPQEDLQALYRTMLLARAYDDQRLRLQRQGRIGTFAPVKGQEAAQLGSVYALTKEDWVVPSFRELAVAMWRGARLEDDLLYCAGYEEGVRIPEDAHDLPLAIPVASQLPHAVGVAWGRRLQGKHEVALVYFGDGATSEGDFHEALNFASVLKAPVVFFCQNNHYAISVPREKQTASRTLAQKALAYDMPGIQVDGNDLLAVYRVVSEAVARARRGEGPTLIEAVTYRLGVHTTADDPTKYRTLDEVAEWEVKDPLPRLRNYLLDRGALTEEGEAGWIEATRQQVTEAVERFEARRETLGDPLGMFDHLYANPPAYLERQRDALAKRLGERGRREEAARADPAQEDLATETTGAFTGVPRRERVGADATEEERP